MAGSPSREAKLCTGPRFPLKRVIATDADHNATQIWVLEAGDEVLEEVEKD